MEVTLHTAYAVCKLCGTRWEVSYGEGRTPQNPHECKNRECEAGWIDIPLFWNEADADLCATEYQPIEKRVP